MPSENEARSLSLATCQHRRRLAFPPLSQVVSGRPSFHSPESSTVLEEIPGILPHPHPPIILKPIESPRFGLPGILHARLGGAGLGCWRNFLKRNRQGMCAEALPHSPCISATNTVVLSHGSRFRHPSKFKGRTGSMSDDNE